MRLPDRPLERWAGFVNWSLVRRGSLHVGQPWGPWEPVGVFPTREDAERKMGAQLQHLRDVISTQYVELAIVREVQVVESTGKYVYKGGD